MIYTLSWSCFVYTILIFSQIFRVCFGLSGGIFWCNFHILLYVVVVGVKYAYLILLAQYFIHLKIQRALAILAMVKMGGLHSIVFFMQCNSHLLWSGGSNLRPQGWKNMSITAKLNSIWQISQYWNFSNMVTYWFLILLCNCLFDGILMCNFP